MLGLGLVESGGSRLELWLNVRVVFGRILTKSLTEPPVGSAGFFTIVVKEPLIHRRGYLWLH